VLSLDLCCSDEGASWDVINRKSDGCSLCTSEDEVVHSHKPNHNSGCFWTDVVGWVPPHRSISILMSQRNWWKKFNRAARRGSSVPSSRKVSTDISSSVPSLQSSSDILFKRENEHSSRKISTDNHVSFCASNASDGVCEFEGTFHIPEIIEDVEEFQQAKPCAIKPSLRTFRRFNMGNAGSGHADLQIYCGKLDDYDARQCEMKLKRSKFGFFVLSDEQRESLTATPSNFIHHLRSAGAGRAFRAMNSSNDRFSMVVQSPLSVDVLTLRLQHIRATHALHQDPFTSNPDVEMSHQHLRSQLEENRRRNRTTRFPALNAGAVAQAIVAAKMVLGSSLSRNTYDISNGRCTSISSCSGIISNFLPSSRMNMGLVQDEFIDTYNSITCIESDQDVLLQELPRGRWDSDMARKKSIPPRIVSDLLPNCLQVGVTKNRPAHNGDNDARQWGGRDVATTQDTGVLQDIISEVDTQAHGIYSSSTTVLDYLSNNLQKASCLPDIDTDCNETESEDSSQDVLSDLPESRTWQDHEQDRVNFRADRIHTDDSLLAEISDVAFKSAEFTLTFKELRCPNLASDDLKRFARCFSPV